MALHVAVNPSLFVYHMTSFAVRTCNEAGKPIRSVSSYAISPSERSVLLFLFGTDAREWPFDCRLTRN